MLYLQYNTVLEHIYKGLTSKHSNTRVKQLRKEEGDQKQKIGIRNRTMEEATK